MGVRPGSGQSTTRSPTGRRGAQRSTPRLPLKTARFDGSRTPPRPVGRGVALGVSCYAPIGQGARARSTAAAPSLVPHGRSFEACPRTADRVRAGRIEAAAAVALYGMYELVRGFGGEDWTAARLHTADIVGLERSLGIFWERGIQTASARFPGFAGVLGVLYISLHFVGHDRLSRVGAPPPAGRVRGCADDARRLDGARARRLPHVPRRSATPRRPRLHRHSHEERRRQPRARTCSARCTTRSRPFPSLHFGYALIVGAGLAMLAARHG